MSNFYLSTALLSNFVKPNSQVIEEEEIEVDCTQGGKSQKSQKDLSKDELNRKVHLHFILFMFNKLQYYDCNKNQGKYMYTATTFSRHLDF